MIFRLRYLPPVLGVIGAIAGVTSISGLVPDQSKALTPFATEALSVERLQNLNDLKVGETREAEGIEIRLNPQSTLAMHSLTGLGSPNWTTDNGNSEVYDVAGTDDGGMIAPLKVVVSYEATAATDYELKATRVFVPSRLVANRN